jgi:chemotaxis protein MotB
LEEAEGARANLATTLDSTERTLAELRQREARARERLATFRSMLERFRAMIEAGRLRVRVVRNRMVVELPAGVLFDSGEAQLKDEGEQTLIQVAQVLQAIANRDFQVAGHTDNVPIHGRFRSNWELSTQRAVNVAKFLIEQGVPGARLSAAGYAETQPALAPDGSIPPEVEGANDTAEERQSNRRIEIVLMPNLDELPDLSMLGEQPQ